MKSAVFYGKHDLRIEDYPMPKAGAHDIVIQVKACGVCGTDVHIYDGDKGAAEVTPPTILGHEFAGVIAEVGSEVTGYQLGDRVCIDPNCYCGTCEPCRSGEVHFCEHMIGYGTTVNGGFAEYCVVNESQVYKLGTNTTFEQGAMTEPVACCLHGIDLCSIRPGHQVVVIGGGMIGLLMLQLARLAGAAKVALLEPIESKREVGKELGADICIDPIHENVKASYLPIKGLQQLLKTIGKVRKQINPKLQVGGILFTMVDAHTNDARNNMELLRNVYGSQIHIFDNYIKFSVRMKEAVREVQSIFSYDPKGKATEAYRRVTEEVLEAAI